MIRYAEYKPAESLDKYISAYWTLETGALYQPVTRPVFADGCAELFINIGDSTPSVNKITLLAPGKVYIGGTMTESSKVGSVPNSRFTGIRFKPSGFGAFYPIEMHEFVDYVVEFPEPGLYQLAELDEGIKARLDKYFIRKLMSKKQETIHSIINTIEQSKGLITVDDIARTHYLGHRTLERVFTKNIGISPKEYINIIRFQHTLKKLQKTVKPHNFLGLAIDMGYYDQAHFAREIKKYSGLTPSEIVGRP